MKYVVLLLLLLVPFVVFAAEKPIIKKCKDDHPVCLKTGDGTSYTVPASLIKVSKKLHDQVADSVEIDLSHFDCKLLEDQIGLMYAVSEQRKKNIRKDDIIQSLLPHLQAASPDDLIKSIRAARYLDVSEMVQAACTIGAKRKREIADKLNQHERDVINEFIECVFLSDKDPQKIVVKMDNEAESIECDMQDESEPVENEVTDKEISQWRSGDEEHSDEEDDDQDFFDENHVVYIDDSGQEYYMNEHDQPVFIQNDELDEQAESEGAMERDKSDSDAEYEHTPDEVNNDEVVVQQKNEIKYSSNEKVYIYGLDDEVSSLSFKKKKVI